MTSRLRVGIAGLGRVFDLNSLGYASHPDIEVVGLCDARGELVEQRRTAFPGARRTTDFKEMLGWGLDLVDILTPHPLHADMTCAALATGAHVTVQKPMAMTVAECDRMIAAADAAGRRLKL
ncbi:MAG: Gfo/Idh/MocA family oxidoreductase, partial [Alphaproteobacteria bacterium]|nr:Gfo/Idh/MocA family oxidoreductase [Alphaproteobacteria bacterium]